MSSPISGAVARNPLLLGQRGSPGLVFRGPELCGDTTAGKFLAPLPTLPHPPTAPSRYLFPGSLGLSTTPCPEASPSRNHPSHSATLASVPRRWRRTHESLAQQRQQLGQCFLQNKHRNPNYSHLRSPALPTTRASGIQNSKEMALKIARGRKMGSQAEV